MSSILKALKRLEEEKAQRDAAVAGISGRIAKSGFVVDRPSPWRIPLAMAAVAAVAVAATYGIMGGFGSRPKPASPPAQSAPAAPIPTPPASSVSSVPQAQQLVPQVVPSRKSRPAAGTTPMPGPTTNAPVGQTPLAQPSAVSVPQGRGGESTVPAAPAAARPEPALVPAPSPPTESAQPLLQVSGIAWQKDAASRVAMVNGAAVTKGGVVGKARVEEIFPDRVRFSLDGRSFDVPLGTSSGGRP